AADITKAGGRAVAVATDVAVAADVEAMVGTAVARFGGVDILVNNAAVEPSVSLLELAEATFDRAIAVNLKGPWLCARTVVPLMVERGRGHIVNTSSVLGMTAFPNDAPYGTTKAAVIALTRAMALEWSALGIHANCIVPGSTDTPMMWAGLAEADIPAERMALGQAIPVGRIATADEIARISLWLVTEDSAYVNGTTIVADGGVSARNPSPR
ncbi:MAG TPA: SDR family oxidoreductase, partial [Candidatus Limnocylindrales bacterium]|nr:SDR family oxidoreductase [Candidatus Limnocylindrales bacterium]